MRALADPASFLNHRGTMLRAAVLFIVQNMLVLLMFAVGVATPLAAVRRHLRARLILRAAFAMFVIVPLVSILTVSVFDLPPGFRTLIILVGVTPAVPFFLTGIKGDRGAALVVLGTASLAAPLTVTFWLWATARMMPLELAASPWTVARTILVTAVLPLVAGLGLRLALPRFAVRLAPWARRLALFAIGVTVLAALALAWRALGEFTPAMVGAMIVATAGAMIAGDLLGRPDPDERRALSAAAAMGNPPLAIALVAAQLPSVHGRAVALVCAFLVLRAIFVALVHRGVASRRRRRASGLAEGTP